MFTFIITDQGRTGVTHNYKPIKWITRNNFNVGLSDGKQICCWCQDWDWISHFNSQNKTSWRRLIAHEALSLLNSDPFQNSSDSLQIIIENNCVNKPNLSRWDKILVFCFHKNLFVCPCQLIFEFGMFRIFPTILPLWREFSSLTIYWREKWPHFKSKKKVKCINF